MMEQRSSSGVERPTRVEQLVGVPASHRVFVVYAPEDTWFVEGFLLQALGIPEDDVLMSSKLELGAPIVKAIERGALCPVTVVVMSPAFLVSPWAQFAYELATHRSVEAAPDGSATVVQAVVADCELPLLSRFRESLDFRRRAPGHWEAEVERLRRKLAASVPEALPVPCPYPGIRPFKTEEAAYFHGRDDEIRDLLGRLRDGRRELYVIGPSGSGKSSLVVAGLVPSLQSSPARAGGSFLVVRMRPGADPIAALTAALHANGPERIDAMGLEDAIDRLLASHPEHDRLLLFIDQLEELFTVAEPPARSAFIAAVRALRGDDRIALVLALRADFYASLMESALWADLGGQLSRLDVSPLRGRKLRTAIEAPARGLGVYFEPVLVERLLNDVADEPGALPLLQDTLLDLWHSRTRGLLRLAEYEAMSDGTQTGLAVTVARRADGALRDLSPARRATARRVLLRLIQFGDGSAPTRRQQSRGALATTSDSAGDIDLVIRHLADRRLITISGGDDAEPSARIDLAHEVLLSAWPTLGEWLRSRRHDEQRRRALEAKAAEWIGNGGGPSRLLDAEELREAHSWLDDDQVRDLGVSEDVVRLLARSKAALDAQRAEAEARRRRVRRWIASTFAVLVGAVIAVSALAVFAEQRSQVADDQSREARRQAGVADQQSRQAHQQLARNLISQAQPLLLGGHPEQAIPYLVAARDAGADGVPIRMLFRWASRSVPIQQVVHGGPVRTVAWSPDGRRIATASGDWTARIWDAVDGHAVTEPLSHHGDVRAVAWSPDGKRVATASDDQTVRVWDVASGKPVTPPLLHHGGLWAVAWSPDGQRIATASSEGIAQIWSADIGQPVTPPLMHHGSVLAVAWSPDGTRVATASDDHTAQTWDARTGRTLAPPLGHRRAVVAVAWSPDGQQLATASDDGTARVWNAASGQAVTPPLGHQAGVLAVAWSPDGRRVATASDDDTARVWDAASGQAVTPPLAHRGRVLAVAWSPDGRSVATASEDQTVQVWDAATAQPVQPPLSHQDAIWVVAWSPDGKRLATASTDNTARVWNALGEQPMTLEPGS